MRQTHLGILAALLGWGLALPGPARADFAIYARESGINGGAVTQIGTGADFTNATFTGTYGDFDLTIFGAASHNTAALSSLLDAVVSIKNNAADFREIALFSSQTNYTLPAGTPLAVESGLSGTVNTGTLTGAGVFTAFADRNNNLLGMGDFSNGPQNTAFSGSTFDTGSAFGSFDRIDGQPYSVTSEIDANVSGGGEGNFSSHVNLTAPGVTPEPSTFVMALTGLPVLGLGWWWRRRTAQAG